MADEVSTSQTIAVAITLNPRSGDLTIESPAMRNKVLMYGILDAAKDAVREFNEEASESRIALPSFQTMRRVNQG